MLLFIFTGQQYVLQYKIYLLMCLNIYFLIISAGGVAYRHDLGRGQIFLLFCL